MRLEILVIILWLVAKPALAYIEPGSGGMMVQLFAAGMVGVWVWIRIYWRRFLSFFQRKPKVEPPGTPVTEGAEQ